MLFIFSLFALLDWAANSLILLHLAKARSKTPALVSCKQTGSGCTGQGQKSRHDGRGSHICNTRLFNGGGSLDWAMARRTPTPICTAPCMRSLPSSTTIQHKSAGCRPLFLPLLRPLATLLIPSLMGRSWRQELPKKAPSHSQLRCSKCTSFIGLSSWSHGATLRWKTERFRRSTGTSVS